MLEIHCHRCGGFIGHPAGTMYREASMGTPPAAPHSGMCVCGAPTVTGPEPVTASRVHHIRSASRN